MYQKLLYIKNIISIVGTKVHFHIIIHVRVLYLDLVFLSTNWYVRFRSRNIVPLWTLTTLVTSSIIIYWNAEMTPP